MSNIIEAFGYSVVEALRSLRALLLVRHNIYISQDEYEYYYAEYKDKKCYVQNQKVELGEYLLYRTFVRLE